MLLCLIYYSCKEDQLELIETNPSVIITDVKNRIKDYNLSVSSPNFNSLTFEQQWGYPDYSKSGSLLKDNGQEALLIPLKENSTNSIIKNVIVSITHNDKIYYGIPEKTLDSPLHDFFQDVLNDDIVLESFSTFNCPPGSISYNGEDSPCGPGSIFCCVTFNYYFDHIDISPIELPVDGWTGGGGGSSDSSVESFYSPNGDCPFAVSGADACFDMDSLIYGELIDYPCAFDLIDNFVGLEDSISKIFYELFGLSDSIHIEYIVNSTIPGSGFATYIIDDQGDFVGKLHLNPNILNSSKEYILATIIHEMIHVYVHYHIVLLSQGIISQEQFDSLFPLYNANDEGHIDMANNYLDAIANALKSYNPNLTNDEAIGLAWEGLENHASELWDSIDSDTKFAYIYYQLAAKDPNYAAGHHFSPCN